jgi:hypothetical protein
VRTAAENALAANGYVCPVDLLVWMGLLHDANVRNWRNGYYQVLEEAIQGSPDKVRRAMSLLKEWAKSRGLTPMEARYVRTIREGEQELRFSETKYPDLEKAFHVHYVSPSLSTRWQENLKQKLNKAPERVVFFNLQDSTCSECGVELESGGFLAMENEQPLCLACAKLDNLEFLEAGDTALTRRASKYSDMRAVVVQFSRSRKRYERQGILVTAKAIEKAEAECAADAPERARRREQDAIAHKKEDAQLVEQFTAKIRAMFPGCPPDEAARIAKHAATRGSGRVGRSAAGRRLDSDVVTLAVIASIRHIHTNYDELLAEGVERPVARERVQEKIELVLDSWRWGL